MKRYSGIVIAAMAAGGLAWAAQQPQNGPTPQKQPGMASTPPTVPMEKPVPDTKNQNTPPKKKRRRAPRNGTEHKQSPVKQPALSGA
jgi:outer membrane biosynthesis protein TonB